MNVVAFAEQREGKFRKVAFEVVQTSKKFADQLGASHVTVAIGDNLSSALALLAPYGASKVITAEDPRLQQYSTTAYAKVLAEIAKREKADIIFLPASQMGKDLAPRIGAKLEAGIAADCVALNLKGADIIATRPVYAGKALIDVVVKSAVKIFTLRPNVFTATPGSAGTIASEKATVELTDADFTSKVTHVSVNAGRPDVTEASIIVSGGRGLKGPEHFHLVESLADTLGAAVGASRAVVDAGWRPHDEQVGQTGKTVSPSLYIACGISGAVQHLAGMSSSKYIVAINKDKDAPIFQVADYGIAGDLFEVIPALNEELKKSLGK